MDLGNKELSILTHPDPSSPNAVFPNPPTALIPQLPKSPIAPLPQCPIALMPHCPNPLIPQKRIRYHTHRIHIRLHTQSIIAEQQSRLHIINSIAGEEIA